MLFFRELKKVIFSISFLIFLAAVIAMSVSQGVMDFSDSKIEMPMPGQDYGTQDKEIPEVIMPAALASLYGEFSINSYITYPIGFYKNVKLNDKKHRQMAEILSALTGVSVDELITAGKDTVQGDNTFSIGDGEIAAQEDGIFITVPEEPAGDRNMSSIALKETISYEEFKEYMAQADKLLGGGSDYSETYLIGFGKVAITYEEAMAQYQLSKDVDHFTGAYARLFCDYLARVLSLVPVFLAVELCLKDKQRGMDALIYTRKASSLRIIMTRYLAILTSAMLPTIILSYISNASIWQMYEGMTLDYLAPLMYDMGWLLPSVMISAAVGMCLTELTDTPIAIAVQGLWWFWDSNSGIAEMHGGYSLLRLEPRHNSLKYTQIFVDKFQNLAANRVLFAGMSLLLVGAAIIIYEQKRRGKLNGYGRIKRHLADMAHSKN